MEDGDTGGSAPCMAHLLIDGTPVDPIRMRDVARFRAAERARLLKARRHLSVSRRAEETQILAAKLETLAAPQKGMRISAYWPIRGEPDLRDWMADGRDRAILVGGPDGLGQASRQRADSRRSLSALTLPHPLVRVIVAEQLFRAHSMLIGHPYHRA